MIIFIIIDDTTDVVINVANDFIEFNIINAFVDDIINITINDAIDAFDVKIINDVVRCAIECDNATNLNLYFKLKIWKWFAKKNCDFEEKTLIK